MLFEFFRAVAGLGTQPQRFLSQIRWHLNVELRCEGLEMRLRRILRKIRWVFNLAHGGSEGLRWRPWGEIPANLTQIRWILNWAAGLR